MSSLSTSHKPLALEPLELPSGDDAPDRGPDSRVRFSSSDEFLTQAGKEYEAGNIDQPLWDRTASRHGEDQALIVAAYLRARATALQMRKRNERTNPRGVPPVAAASAPAAAQNAKPSQEAKRASRTLSIGGQRKVVYGGAATAAVVVLGIVWFAMSSSTAPASPSAAAPAPVSSAKSAPASATPAVGAASQDLSLETKVAELKRAGNWNVLVLYAAEWTRKQPDNAQAWTELSVGYTMLKQWGDALESARKAVQLAPDDVRHQRNLGQVTLAVDRLPEARAAFDKVLAASADDPDALCGAAMVAKGEGRAKEADLFAARVRAIGVTCDGLTQTAAVPPPSATTARGSAPARGR